MRIVYRITEKDFMAACNLIIAVDKPLLRVLPWIGGYSLLAGLAYLPFAPNWLRVVVEISVFMSLSCVYVAYALRRSSRHYYQNDHRFEHDFTADISENGIHISTTTAESKLKWSAFLRFLESDQSFCAL
jgi:hypothetical protein